MERIAIVGLGLIGGSLALSLRRANRDLIIVGVDEDLRTLEMARDDSAIDAAFPPDKAPLQDADLVVLATPAPTLLAQVADVAGRMRPGAVLSDVCGSKERVCAAGAAQERVVFVGAHPMAGTEFRGFVAASPALFSGCTVAICPPVGAPDAQLRRAALAEVRKLWSAVGAARVLDVDPAAHDRAVTIASHLPYLAAAEVVDALLRAGDVSELARDLAAGGFRDTTRLAGDGTVGGAAALNRFVPEAARALAARLCALADALERDAGGALQDLARLAEERRRMHLPK